METKAGRILGKVSGVAFNSMWNLAAVGLGVGIAAFGSVLMISGAEQLVSDIRRASTTIVAIVKEGTEKVA